jgi:hypothetical protein
LQADDAPAENSTKSHAESSDDKAIGTGSTGRIELTQQQDVDRIKVQSTKTIHSRSNKEIGDIIEGDWEITAKRVIAEPHAGRNGQAPRFGIYEYDVKQIISRAAAKPALTRRESESGVGGTRREASTVPLTVRRTS